MAGSIVVTTSEVFNDTLKYSVLWTSDSAGDVSGSTFATQFGTILRVEFIPGTGGSQPTDLYDVDMLNGHDVSMFDNGAGTTVGSNLSNTNASHHLPLIGVTGVAAFRRWTPGGLFQPVVANAGASKSGTIDIYIYRGLL